MKCANQCSSHCHRTFYLTFTLLSAPQAYEARFTIRLAVHNIPEDVYPTVHDPSLKHACYAAEVALRVYFDDVRNLVQSNLTAILNPLLEHEDHRTRRDVQEQLTALARWIDEEFPLSYSPGILSNLLHAITDPAQQQFELTPSILGQKPLSFLADTIIDQCSHINPHRQPPFMTAGNFLSVMHVAMEEIRSATTLAGSILRDIL